DRAAKEIVSVTRGENTITLNSNDSFDDLYLNEAKITPIYVKEGYTFKYWSTESNKTLPIIPSEGLIDTYENGAIDMQVLDNITLYLIYVINEYTITYSTNDADKGVLAYNNDESEGRDQFAVVLKYGRTTKPVTAVPNSVNNFVFSHWVIVDSEGNETEYSKSKEIIIDAVTKDLTFKAIFRGNEITITINVTLPESELIGNYTELDKEELYFSEITFDGTVGTPSFNKDGLIQSWTFKTYAGENVGFTFTEKNGYVFAYCNPYLNMEAAVSGSQGPIPFTTSTLYYSASYDIAMKARTNTVLIKIINNKGTDPKGANIFEDHNNSLGIENVEIIGDQKALEYQVKTGGSIQAFLNIYEGYIFDYMSVAAYFNEPTQAVDSDIYISTGEIKNISSDMEILLYVRPYVYEVTFEYNYEGAPVSVVAQVEIGELDFTPALPESIFGPNRPKYNFIGWSMDKAYQTETTYLFDNGQIYRYEYVDYNAVKVYGFNGTSNAVASTKEGVDFECTLYAYWELIKHKVDVVFVPTTALQNSNINYTQMFPNTEGRYLRFADDFSQRVEGISYVPEVLVEIVAPGCYEGYEYYGWSYDGDITNKAKINVGKYSQIMIEEDIVVYLYYTLEVKVISNGHGTVTPESAKVLYNGTISLDGKPDAAYLFDRWVLNGNIIPNSKQKMDVTITEPSNIEAIYL
ncbi:MAG: InlB B-repeat-containing protein, partial [Clostridia bacterium]|nr:InlB B-repeat-containing protein [Clostridia bacterium]